MIGTESAAIDRWIEPATEPEPTCRSCGHELSWHDCEHGCAFTITDIDDGYADYTTFCECERFI